MMMVSFSFQVFVLASCCQYCRAVLRLLYCFFFRDSEHYSAVIEYHFYELGILRIARLPLVVQVRHRRLLAVHHFTSYSHLVSSYWISSDATSSSSRSA